MGLRMTRVEPQMKLRLLLQTKLLPQRRRGDASLANSLRCVTRPLPVWFREQTTQRLHKQLVPSSLITQEPRQPTTHGLQHSAVVRHGLRCQKLPSLLLSNLLSVKSENICRNSKAKRAASNRAWTNTT